MDNNVILNQTGMIRTYSGLLVKPMRLNPEDIRIADIAQALSRICRFAGHVSGFLSVAEHSVEVSRLCPPELRMDGLLHDASEAYLGDIPSPIKRLPEMTGWRAGEERAHKAIAKRFGTKYPHPDPVTQADRDRLYVEIEDWRDTGRGMLPNEACEYFLDTFVAYGGLMDS